MRILIAGFVLLVIAAALGVLLPQLAAVSVVLSAGGWVAIVIGAILLLIEVLKGLF
jgi:hypothetical protein